MVRVTKLADYGLMLLTTIARDSSREEHTARDLAEGTGVALETVRKVMKSFARAGVLKSQRGVHGGYKLARPSASISLVDIIEALEGPISVTECCDEGQCSCKLEPHCQVSGAWHHVNRVIIRTLRAMSLEDVTKATKPLKSAKFEVRSAKLLGR